MPELPEVEVVRRGVTPAVTGATVLAVEVRDPRALKRHRALGEVSSLGHGATLDAATARTRKTDFERRLTGAVLGAPARRGKFLWVPLRRFGGGSTPDPAVALVVHLGMSGQLLVRDTAGEDDRHVRVRLWLDVPDYGELRLDFCDQRLFGSLALDTLCTTAARGEFPRSAAHIAPDPLEALFDDDAWVQTLRSRGVAVKRALLDQRLASGIGNIYADEALWLARIHPHKPASRISETKLRELLGAVREVFTKALAEGGTSFDDLYVNVNGESGYFAHSLNAYGRGGLPCGRCGTALKRSTRLGRATVYCPRCQR